MRRGVPRAVLPVAASLGQPQADECPWATAASGAWDVARPASTVEQELPQRDAVAGKWADREQGARERVGLALPGVAVPVVAAEPGIRAWDRSAV